MGSKHLIETGEAKLTADVVGDGVPVIFLHAAVCDRRMWRTQMDVVGTQCRAIAYDRRGFGETTAGGEDFSSVADLMTVMDTLIGGPAVLVGSSQGGRIAIDAALRNPSRVRGLVLIAPGVTGSPAPTYSPSIEPLMAELWAAQKTGDLDRVNAIKARHWLDGPLAPEGRVKGPARELFLEMNGIALRASPIGADLDTIPAYPRLAEIQIPTMVVWGDLEFPFLKDRCRHIAAVVRNGSGRALTGTAHLPSLDQPNSVTELITGFIQNCCGRSSDAV